MTSRRATDPLWYVYLIHRVSGLMLALFLPVHFYILGMALNEAALDGALSWTDHPMAKVAEAGLVFLLTLHLFGGLRLLAIEWLPWAPREKTLAAVGVTGAVLISGLFFLKAL
ncbi:MAG: succinate dehydrogenase [Pseudomonadota bacterium]